VKLAVLGAGAWGTALAIHWSQSHAVTLWGRNPQSVAAMRALRENRAYLPGFALPAALELSASLAAAKDADLVVLAVPTAGLRQTLEQLAASVQTVPPLIWVCKGFEPGSRKLPHEVLGEVLPGQRRAGVLSGPSFAQEVANGLPTALTLASGEAAFAHDMAQALVGPRLRIYVSNDVVGVEVGGATKNVMAIAAGICDGLGLGHNARAALITRGLAEMTRLGVALGGRAETFMGLSGLGDLILTATGDLSRNRRVGLGLARNEPLAALLGNLGHVAEGVSTTRELMALAAALGVELPITAGVGQILFHGMPAEHAIDLLLNREIKREFAWPGEAHPTNPGR
jgi:glycerol-3-phosphate dehydrogenase (NAD(P)+)